MKQRNFEIKPDFKAAIGEILVKLSFSNVHGIMNLLKRESTTYSEQESNAIVGFLGELAYRDVAQLFEAMPQMITEIFDETEGPVSEAPLSKETVEETAVNNA